MFNPSGIGCEDRRWIHLAHDCVEWQNLVLAKLSLWVLLLECYT
jgi:hypothetical protein